MESQSFFDWVLTGPDNSDFLPNALHVSTLALTGGILGVIGWEWKGREMYKRATDPEGSKDVVKIRQRRIDTGSTTVPMLSATNSGGLL